MDYKLGFKVYRLINGVYLSATECGVVTEYVLDKPTTPNIECGPLAVFEHFDDAKEFAKNEGQTNDKVFVVLLCSYLPSSHIAMWPWMWGMANCITLTKTPMYCLPPGSVLADEVVLHGPAEWTFARQDI